MTAHELAKALLAGPDLPVHYAYNSRDHWRTEVAPEVKLVEQDTVAYSEYHEKIRIVTDDEGRVSGEKTVVVLR